MKTGVKEFILKSLNQQSLDGSTNLIESGILDSMAFLDLITALENEYKVSIDFGDRDPNEFLSVDGLVALVTNGA